MKNIFTQIEKQWREFGNWELRQKSISGYDKTKTLELVGQWTDFFLSRYPRSRQLFDTRGIQKMHECLSHLS